MKKWIEVTSAGTGNVELIPVDNIARVTQIFPSTREEESTARVWFKYAHGDLVVSIAVLDSYEGVKASLTGKASEEKGR